MLWSCVVCFILGNFQASEFYIPTFRSSLFHLQRQVDSLSVPSSKAGRYLPDYEDGTECSETSEYKIQTPVNYPEESIQHSEHGESLKSRILWSYLAIYSISSREQLHILNWPGRKVTTHLRLVLRLLVSGAVTSLLRTSSWRAWRQSYFSSHDFVI